MTHPIRVLVVDDQEMFRVGLAAILDAQPDITVAGQAADGAEARQRVRSLQPDVVLMDVRMPVLNGIDATREILSDPAIVPYPRIVMLTTFDIDDYVFDALRAGASGFLLKDATPAQLVEAVRTVHGGEALLAPRATTMLVQELTRTAARPRPQAAVFAELTDREREVFLLIAEGLSNTEIAGRLFIAEQTAKTHVSRVLGKLGLRDRVHAVVLAYETGLITPGERG